MRLLDAVWTPKVNMLLLLCDCGKHLFRRGPRRAGAKEILKRHDINISIGKVERGGDGCIGEECEYWEECGREGEGCHAPLEDAPPQKPPVRVALAVWDWIDPARPASVYSTEDGVEYGIGDLHSGTVFRGSLELSAEDADTIRAAAAKGHQPLFRLMLEDGDGAHHGR